MSAEVKDKSVARPPGERRPNGREALRRLAAELQCGEAAGLAEQPVGGHWSGDDLANAFGNITSNIADEAESEDAIEVLLGLIRSEVDKLEAMTAMHVEEVRQSGARIDRMLDKAACHQAITERWLSRLP